MSERLVYLDNLRVLMVTLVLVVHSAVTYSDIGSWYYVENDFEQLDLLSTVVFAIFGSFTQAYFMGLLFLIAGYLVPRSLERKGPRRFVGDRAKRLGIPTLIFMLTLGPLTILLANPELKAAEFFRHMVTSADFIGLNGPMWFAIALLIFSLVYALAKALPGTLAKAPAQAPADELPGAPAATPAKAPARPPVAPATFAGRMPQRVTVGGALALSLAIALFAFALRLVWPMDTDVYNFQLSFFGGYIVFFAVGIAASRTRLLDSIDFQQGKRWFIASVAIGVPSWIAMLVIGGVLDGARSYQGGMNLMAFGYALWESTFAVVTIVGLLGLSKRYLNRAGSALSRLSENSFAVYVLHPPLLVGVALLISGVPGYPLVKWVVLVVLGTAVTFAVAHTVRRIGVVRRVLS